MLNVFREQEELDSRLCTDMSEVTFQDILESHHLSKCDMTKQLKAKETTIKF